MQVAIALGDQEGNLHWLNKETGELVAREDFDSSGFFVEPVVTDDKLILYTPVMVKLARLKYRTN
ncbi:hypothetical protein ACOBV9_23155 (plasmid) [Pseudoalteromonas espejiana]